LQAIAFGLGGEAGARLATQLQMLVSADTLLRLIRKWSPPKPPTPKKVGVDDWALRKRVTYGTIVVDLETHQPIDLLEDRTSAVLKAWLLEHQQIEVIARDRSGEYASGATEGAPQAIQVADRFHLLQNLKQMLDRLLTMMYRQIRPLLIVEENNGQQVCMPTRLLSSIRDSSAHEQAASTASRERRLETYQQIKQLKSAGWKIGQISRRLDINPTTVRKHFYAETFPERASRPARGSILDPYLKHLESRYREGCSNALQLWREIKEKGYQGTRRQVSKWMSKRREQDQTVVCSTEGPTVDNSSSSPPPRPLSNALPSPRQLAWLMMRQSEQLNQEENKILARIQENTQVKQIHTLSQEFIGMVKKRDVAQLVHGQFNY
jgi:transposase